MNAGMWPRVFQKLANFAQISSSVGFSSTVLGIPTEISWGCAFRKKYRSQSFSGPLFSNLIPLSLFVSQHALAMCHEVLSIANMTQVSCLKIENCELHTSLFFIKLTCIRYFIIVTVNGWRWLPVFQEINSVSVVCMHSIAHFSKVPLYDAVQIS